MQGKQLHGWRRVAAAMWEAPDDPQIFGKLEVDARPVRRAVEEGRRAGAHVTPTHVVGRAVAHALEAVPELNVQIRGGRAYPRPTIDVFFIAAVANGDLSGIKIVDVPHKTVTQIASELGERATAVKEGRTILVTESARAVFWSSPGDLSYQPGRSLPPLGWGFRVGHSGRTSLSDITCE